ncbi:MAG: RNA polymerase factor sigma-54 [Aestuariivirgaceae bacterium]|nr:RNA polymerase factor sigma-54 [Aestuariivirgaceae bacterium]
MGLSHKLEMRQGQSLVMTPQLQQAIKLLQMSNFEIQTFVETELERNPLLDRDEKAAIAAETIRQPTDMTTELQSGASTAERLEAMDTDLTNVYADEAKADTANREAAAGNPEGGWAGLRQNAGGGHGADDMDYAQNVTREETLNEHLTDQLHLAIADPARRLIGAHLIGMVNEAGYLSGEMESVCELLGASLGEVEEVLTILQGFEPAGVFARSLQECLAIQLKEHDRYDPAMQRLIENLELVAKRDFVGLERVCGVDHEDIRDMVAELRALNPKPGNAFGTLIVQPVVPDVFVRAAQDGTWHVELNSETLPRVLVNNQYYARVSATAARDTDKLYLSECLSTAAWLVKSLDQRARTILQVAREIVRQQDSFFLEGVSGLRPLNLRTVADAISMHESTVSRVTSNKYIGTPRGIFEMKYFFTTAINATEGEPSHSAEAVRHRIKRLIEGETVKAVLSDDQLVELLRAEGVDIARRTVAKYREALGLPSSVQRRREKRAYG